MATRRSVLAAGAGLAAVGVSAQQQSDWELKRPDDAGLRAALVGDTLRAGESVPGLRALLVARHGALVAERYYGGTTVDSLRFINSATKSVCSLLVGLALSDGRLKSLDDTVAQLIPEAIAAVPKSLAADTTLRQILTGRTGFDRDWKTWPEIEKAKPMVPYALSHLGEPTASATGWSYNDAMVALIAPILRRAQGVDLGELATRQLFRPMNIERYEWDRDEDGNCWSNRGLVLRPRDLLKFAVMMIDRGRWRGTQVVPESWVAESLTTEGPSTWRTGPLTDVGYGLLWFTGRLHGYRVAWAWGFASQFCLLAPDLGLAVATAATTREWLKTYDPRTQNNAVMTLVGRMIEAAA